MKRKLRKQLAALLSLCLLVTAITPAYADVTESEPYYIESENRTNSSLLEGIEDVVIAPSVYAAAGTGVGGTLLPAGSSEGYDAPVLKLEPNSEYTFTISVPQAGGYHVELDYYIPETSMRNLSLALQINGEYQFYDSRNMELSAVWADDSQDYSVDYLGNELYAQPVRVFRWQHAPLNSLSYNLTEPFVFEFKAGENEITITTNEVAVMLGNITLAGKYEYASYEEYKATTAGQSLGTDEMLIIEAEKYSEKTESYIRANKSNSQKYYPYDPVKNQMNSLAGASWLEPNEGVTYEFEIKNAGVYYFAFKYNQGTKKDMPVFKNIYIDGEVMFEEMLEYQFDYTSTRVVNEVLSVNDEAVGIYLEPGVHTLTLVSTSSMFFETYENLLNIIDRINDISLEIKTITGNKSDEYRDWDIEIYLPGLQSELLELADILTAEYNKLNSISNKKDAQLVSNLNMASYRLREFADDLNMLVNNLNMFSTDSGSVADYVSLILDELLDQPMTIDRIYVTPDVEAIPDAQLGFFANLWEEIKKLALSFFVEYDSAQASSDETVDVWVNRAVTYLDVIREKVQAEYEITSGVDVNISSMTDESKLLLAVSAGTGPDVVLGASNYRPFDFALRGAVKDLREFDDFGTIIDDFQVEMFVPFIIDDSCYGVPETTNFQVLFYRTDIMDTLNLEVPNTWDDVVAMLPTLSRYGMNFNTAIANVGSSKHFGTTVPFIQQFEGEVYAADGTQVLLGNPNTVEAFKLMTDLYTRYSLPENIPNFYNNFKKGTTPIGMSDLSTYILLKNAAPEIAGQWKIALGVGVEDENGDVLRYQPSVMTCCLIMESTNMPQESWEFLKWWISEETQTTFATQLQLRFGPEFVWSTANMKALANSTAFEKEDLEIILAQLAQTMEIPRNPAYFIVERELSNAWNAVVFEGQSPRTALDNAITVSNRAITKKLVEFDYIDEDGNLVKPFEMATAEKVLSWKERAE